MIIGEQPSACAPNTRYGVASTRPSLPNSVIRPRRRASSPSNRSVREATAKTASSVMTIEVSDVDEVCEDLSRRGVELLNGPIDRSWGRRTASFVDPAGHVWEIAQSIEAVVDRHRSG